MDVYSHTHDVSLFDFNYSDHPGNYIFESLTPTNSRHPHQSIIINHDDDDHYSHLINDAKSSYKQQQEQQQQPASSRSSPPRYRHDGTSPLPLGMDWSLPPRKWEGKNTAWPGNPRTGWSYCVTIPSWTLLPKSRTSETIVFYRTLIGLQSPEGITTTRGVLRRFSDFLKLSSDLKKAFPKKNIASAPPKKLLRKKSNKLLEERRCALEDWIETLLSDIDISRSAFIAEFFELEAAARSSFYDVDQPFMDGPSTGEINFTLQFRSNSDISAFGNLSELYDESTYGPSEPGTPRHGQSSLNTMENALPELDIADISVSSNIKEDKSLRRTSNRNGKEILYEKSPRNLPGFDRMQSTDSAESLLSSVGGGESNFTAVNLVGEPFVSAVGAEAMTSHSEDASTNLDLSKDIFVVLPLHERQKLSRVLATLCQRLFSSKTDMEDLIARLNQELAVRQYLTTKVKDLEVDLQSTRQSCKEIMQQAVLIERERYTQTQWDVEELRKECLETELKLKAVEDAKAKAESSKASIIRENEMLSRQLDLVREQLENSKKQNDELELKSKSDVKLLVKEVKSLRGSQAELKKDVAQLVKEKLEAERTLQRERQKIEQATAANSKLLRECEILRGRLQECSVNFLVEEEDKLILDTSSSSDAFDLLTTSDNRISLLLAEAQLMAQDVETAVTSAESPHTNGSEARTDDQLRKMLTDVLVDNATLRKQVNLLLRCTLNTTESEKEEEAEIPFRKTVLSKFL